MKFTNEGEKNGEINPLNITPSWTKNKIKRTQKKG